MSDPIYRLLSIESETPRPRELRTGSLSACLDELKEAVLNDVVACNRGRLSIVAVFETVGGPRRSLNVAVATLTTTGDGF